jgi:ABC-type transport system involved in multi-copper enzyme maturation permease subunit
MSIGTLSTETEVRQEARHSPLAALVMLTGVNLYLVSRRAMSTILLGILLVLFAVEIAFTVFIYISLQNAAQATCPAGSTGCQPPPPQEVAAIHQAQQIYGGFLTFPTSLGVGGAFAGFVGALLLAILAGTVVGGEFGLGTVRISLSRGLSRAQVLAGQVLAVAVLAIITSVVMLLAGALVGVTIGPAFGLTLGTVTLEGAREIVVYGFAVALNVLLYALFAQFFATLGRSTGAGIGAATALIFLEFLVNTVFGILRDSNVLTGDLGNWIKHVPDWLPGNNVGALAAHAGEAPIALTQVTATTVDLTHAALVTAGYIVVLLGATYAFFRLRDVTD